MIEIFPKDKLLTAEEVSSVLNLKPSTVMEWALNGKIPSLKLTEGKKGVVRFIGRKLNEWLEERERVPMNREEKIRNTVKTGKLKANKKIMQDFDNFIENLH